MLADSISSIGLDSTLSAKVEFMKKATIFPVIVLALNLVPASFAHDRSRGDHNKKAVFVMTNSASHNEILSYTVQPDGSLKAYGSFSTGGRGSGGAVDPLGSQGSLTLSQDHALLFAVNAGSGELSSFRVEGPRLELSDVRHTGGSAPVAVAEHGGLVYVLNFAGNSGVTGFKVDDGDLHPIPNSLRYLSTANAGASSLAFSTDGQFLLITEKLTNIIDVFPVMADGTLGAVVTTKDASKGLFDLLVAPDGAAIALEAGNATVTPFEIGATGMLTSLSAPVSTLGAASCWHAVTPDGRFLYTANAGSATISGFSLLGGGVIGALPGTVVATFPAGSTDLDLAISGDGKYLYSLNTGTGTIGMLAIQSDGTLKLIGTLPAFAAKTGFNGIAAL
jgi:6-phosphogluconolactonase (cycloisomerase 2 family)